LLLKAILSKSPENKRDCSPVVVWLADASHFGDNDLAFFTRCLGASEAERYRRFARSCRKRQFLIGRMLLRYAVGKAVGLSPSAFSIQEQPTNAPRLILPESVHVEPGFSLSHSGRWVACAVSRSSMLGLDIEVANPDRDLLAIGKSAFHKNEIASLLKLSGESRVAAFYHLWSLHEALLKLFSNAGRTAQFPELVDAKNLIVSHGDGWHSRVLPHPEFSCVLCSTGPLPSVLALNDISNAELLSATHLAFPKFATQT
jgi:4'-phosphopantetheinyl transferase